MRFCTRGNSSDSLIICFANLKSGIGSCIAPKAGIARHPVKGMCRAGMFLHSGLIDK